MNPRPILSNSADNDRWTLNRIRLIWSQSIWTRGHLDARSFSHLFIRSHGYLVAGHLVAVHLVAGLLVTGHLVALNEKSILTRLFGRESFFCKKGHLQ
jgi:hypothetical protein